MSTDARSPAAPSTGSPSTGALSWDLPLVAPLTDRLLRVWGPDAREWLQGLVSHDVLALPVGTTRYALILDEKGRVVADPTVVAEGEHSLLLVLPAERLERVTEHLQRRLVTEEVELSALPHRGVTVQGGSTVQGAVAVDGVEGGEAPALFAAPPPGLIAFVHDRSGLGGWDLYVDGAEASGALDAWRAGRDASVALEQQRIRAGIPRLGVDLEPTTLPAEAGLFDALHFGKGCYLGQEVVARLAHRGQTTKELRRFHCAAGAVQPGMRLWVTDDEGQARDVGAVTSATPEGEGTVGIAMVKRRWFAAGQVLEARDQAPQDPPTQPALCVVSGERLRAHAPLQPENDPGFRGHRVHRALVS